MVISKQSEISVYSILCKGERIKQVGTFKYLGFTITQDARYVTEIKKRIAFSTDTFTKMKSIFPNRNIRICTKFDTLTAYVIIVYPSEWLGMLDTTKDQEKILEVVEIWYIRRNMD